MIWRYLQLAVFWLSYLAWGILIYVSWQIYLQPLSWWWTVWLLTLLFLYARFIEPNCLKIRSEIFDWPGDEKNRKNKNLRLVLISDLHLGVFKGRKFLQRVLTKILEVQPDLLIIPGDLINDPSHSQLTEMFEPLSALKFPIYAVTGNHDSEKPGFHQSETVRQALRKCGVQAIDNQQSIFEKEGVALNIFGLSDLMEGLTDFSILDKMLIDQFNLIVAHNPDTAYQITGAVPAGLVLSGHTHAGQIRVPWIYKWLIPCKYKFERGWYEVQDRKVYVSSGLGEVILPMRLGVIPEIVVLELRI